MYVFEKKPAAATGRIKKLSGPPPNALYAYRKSMNAFFKDFSKASHVGLFFWLSTGGGLYYLIGFDVGLPFWPFLLFTFPVGIMMIARKYKMGLGRFHLYPDGIYVKTYYREYYLLAKDITSVSFDNSVMTFSRGLTDISFTHFPLDQAHVIAAHLGLNLKITEETAAAKSANGS